MVTRLVVLLILFSTTSVVFGQELSCGTPAPSKKQLALMDKIKESTNSFSGRSNANEPTSLAIAAHIIRQDNGSGGLSEQDLNDAISNVNNYYSNAGLSFFILAINYIDNSQYFDFVTADEAQMTGTHNFENTINIYFANSVGDGDDGFFCGYAYFPGGPDVILMDNSCAVNGSTLPHEIGHFFALYHTHGTTNTGTTDELVTRAEGANCSTAGDQLCDTEADPNLSGQVNGACEYTGNDTDSNGVTFTPDPTNIMSYSTKACRDLFTSGQYERMNLAYTNNRNYLKQADYLADFLFSTQELCTGESVTFTNRSINADTYSWEFEGGTPATSEEENPTITYMNAGTFSATLTITSGGNQDIKTFANAITVDEELVSSVVQEAGSFEESELTERIINRDAAATWERNLEVASEGSNSVYIDLYNYDAVGEEDYLVFAVLNTSVEKSFELTFDYAYAPYSDQYFDGLEVVYKGSCEKEWQSIFFKEGADLATAEATTALFVPDVADWRTEELTLDLIEPYEVIQVAFKAVNGWGNVLYVDNYSIGLPAEVLAIESVQVTNASCVDVNDGSVIVTALGTGPFEYSIDDVNFTESNEFNDLLPGEYTVTVLDPSSGNMISQLVEVLADNDYPEVPVISAIDGELLIEVIGGQDIQWYLNDQLLPEETSATILNPQRGAYVATVSNGGCGVMSDPFIVLAVDEVDNQLTLFPNPAQDYLSVELPNALRNEVKSVKISDLSGRVLVESTVSEKLSVSSLNNGIYLLHLNVDGQILTRRFLKQ